MAFTGKKPTLLFNRLIMKKNGLPRPLFAEWMLDGHVQAEMTWEGRKIEESHQVPFFVDHDERKGDGGDLLVFIAFCPGPSLTDLQVAMLKSYHDAGFRLALIVNSEEFEGSQGIVAAAQVTHIVDFCVVRQNVGFDFSAWSHFLAITDMYVGYENVCFTNDSVLPISCEALVKLRQSFGVSKFDVGFLTENTEVIPHGQSYFVVFTQEAVERGALKVFDDVPVLNDKQELINKCELQFSAKIRDAGYSVGAIFSLQEAKALCKNPTIHFWEELLALGFPFLKIQLLALGIVSLSDERLCALFSTEVLESLRQHLERRLDPKPNSAMDRYGHGPTPTFGIRGRFSSYGALQAWNPADYAVPALLLPFVGAEDEVVSVKNVAVVLHAFYLDVAEELLVRLSASDPSTSRIRFKYYLTTDTQAKVSNLELLLAQMNIDGNVILIENRGRDVAPFLKACMSIDEEYVLHLHTKKSPHDSELSGWSNFLFENLVPDCVALRSISMLLQNPEVGLISSAHFHAVHGRRNWGFDYGHAKFLANRMSLRLDADMLLDFPTGTMFWARTSALAPLVDLRLQSDAFEPEEGQEDGTLAHAIERLMQYVVEGSGFKACKVVVGSQLENTRDVIVRLNGKNLMKFLSRPYAKLSNRTTASFDFNKKVSEIFPVGVARSSKARRRLNVLLPTAKPKKIYGGVATAIKIAREIFDCYGDADLRVIVTSDSVDRASIAELSRRFGLSFVQSMPNQESSGHSVVDLNTWRNVEVSVRAADDFFATAWWTADLGFRLLDAQEDIFSTKRLLTYLIQDFEPGFYAWSDRYGLAEATYQRGDQTMALVNSEELAVFMNARYKFNNAYCIPYAVNEDVRARLKAGVKEKLILCYGRPSVDRNAFATIVEGVRLWQGMDPVESSGWQVVFAGEDFDSSEIRELDGAICSGKLSLADYAALLNRASIGISLMLSPHPSYPPLEMAVAGLRVISNNYEAKNLGLRSENVECVKTVTPKAISLALRQHVRSVDLVGVTPLGLVSDISAPYPYFTPLDVVKAIDPITESVPIRNRIFRFF